MTIKKLICTVLTLLVLMSVAGCGAPQEQSSIPAPTQLQSQSQPEEPETEKLELPEKLTFHKVGEQFQLQSGAINREDILWESGDMSVAAVENGLVTALQRGQTTVTATYEDQSAVCAIDCNLPLPMVRDENAGERDPVYLPPDVELVDDSFFDDAVFISDSQGLIFYNCVRYAGVLKNAVHLCRNSYSVTSAAEDRMLLSWRGQNYPIEEAIEKTEANRVFFMLGINDVGHYSVDTLGALMEKWENVIDRIQTKTPHVEICIQSLIPVWTGGETKDVNNEIVRAYNEQLEILAEEKGCVFIDVAAYFVDSTGGLASPYTDDKYVHTNAAGVDTWVKVLKACTAYGE